MLRWRDDEPILASIGFFSTFQLRPQLIYQIFNFISSYPQPPSSIFHQTCHTAKWCNHPAPLLPCNHWHHDGRLMQMIITSTPKITTDFILLLVSNYPLSNPLSKGPKSLLLQHLCLIILAILYFFEDSFIPYTFVDFIDSNDYNSAQRKERIAEFQATIPAKTSIPTVQLQVHRLRWHDHTQPWHVSRWARIKAKLCSYSCCWSIIHWLIQLTHFGAVEEITEVSLVDVPIVLLYDSTLLPC